ncbi:MAG: carbohydrate ABC transporter permease [Acidimicrobiales bacterium]
MSQILGTLLQVGLAVVVLGILFVGANKLVDLLPTSAAAKVRPWVFVGPALFFLTVALVIPTIRTIYISLLSRDSSEFVGGENYGWVFTNDEIFNVNGFGDIFTSRLFLVGVFLAIVGIAVALFRGPKMGTRADFSGGSSLVLLVALVSALFAVFTSMRGVVWNNLWWVFGVVFIATSVGLAIAVLADRMRGESIAKSLVFLPMAISFVGASVIWRFVYNFQPQELEQIGVLNAVWKGLGGETVAYLQELPWNTFFLMIVLIWGQTGFAMVVLSAAIKAVPDEYLEAARVDGATASQIFWKVTLPQLRTTIGVVVTTLIVLVMKVFDIVKVMTNGEFATNVIANEQFDQSFRFNDFGRGAALAVVLFLAVLPVIIYNVNRIRKEAELG